MDKNTWVILGATSIIAEKFAQLAAEAGHDLLLVARDQPQLAIIAADIRLRYRVQCEEMTIDFAKDSSLLIEKLGNSQREFNLLIAYSLMINNNKLDNNNIASLIEVNIISTVQIIHAYLNSRQKQHRLVYLSSVAAVKGRAKNSLYGASKSAIELYLQGLQQAATKNQFITIARLGFIDTKLTFGEPGIFYASSPAACAKACWRASLAHKRLIYHPFFWRFIMALISRLPFFLYQKMSKL